MKNTHAKRSDSRTFAGAGLFVLSSICMLVALVQLFAAMVPPVSSISVRIGVALLSSGVALVAASLVLGERSILWQGPLQSVAASALIVSVRYLVEAVFTNPHWLTSVGAVVCVAYAFIGFAAAWLMKRLQKRFL
jgi:hypothetical protein